MPNITLQQTNMFLYAYITFIVSVVQKRCLKLYFKTGMCNCPYILAVGMQPVRKIHI